MRLHGVNREALNFRKEGRRPAAVGQPAAVYENVTVIHLSHNSRIHGFEKEDVLDRVT